MLKYFLLGLLCLTFAQCQSASVNSFFLSPSIPSTAYLGQAYEVRFRVRGLDNPVFSFSGLPLFLSATEDGVVSGTPTEVGSYKTHISYSQGKSYGQSDVVIRVTSSSSSAKGPSNAKVIRLVINTLYSGSYIFKVRENINLKLDAAHGLAPYAWAYQSLPAGLRGDDSGSIVGAIEQEGSYTFSASASDSKGANSQSYFTINVQPTFSLSISKLIDVPNRNAPLVFNGSQVLGQQIAANNAVFAALKIVNEKNDSVNAERLDYAKAKICVDDATIAEAIAEAELAAAQAKAASAQNAFNFAKNALNNARNNLALAKTAAESADDNVEKARKDLAKAQEAFDKATIAFKYATKSLDDANNDLSEAKERFAAAQKALKDAQHSYNIAFGNVQSAKTNLSLAQNKYQGATKLVSDAKNAVDLANQANDAAQTAFNNADAAVIATTHKLKDANDDVAHLSEKVNAAKASLGISKFNLQQALNNLYVAQSAKEAADKATAIAQAQGARSITIQTTGESTFILPFAGCTPTAYPTITGTETVVSIDKIKGTTLESGHIIQTGPCTTQDKYQVGDRISYSGHSVGGYINAKKIQKRI